MAIGSPLPGSRNDCRAFTESGVDRACRGAPVIADGGYQGTGLLIPHRRRRVQTHLSPQQEAENTIHRRARARVEHALPRRKNWKILRDCRLKGNGVHQAMLGIARLHNLALTGKPTPHTGRPLATRRRDMWHFSASGDHKPDAIRLCRNPDPPH